MIDPNKDMILMALSERIASEVGLNFPPERHEDLRRALTRAAKDWNLNDPGLFASMALNDPEDGPVFQDLIMRLTIGETHFFRDEKLFRTLETEILPRLVRASEKSGEKLRIWSAGCSTGEEPYSIAMALKRVLPHIDHSRVNLVATDVNPQSLEKAHEGKYTQWSFRGAPEPIRERFFRADEKGFYNISPEIKSMVTFGRHNLVKDPFPPPQLGPGPLDLIFCRNVLMYFTREHIQNITRKFGGLLSEEGGIFVAPAEAEQTLGPELEAVNLGGVIVYRKESPNRVKPRSGRKSCNDEKAIIPARNGTGLESRLGSIDFVSALKTGNKKRLETDANDFPDFAAKGPSRDEIPDKPENDNNKHNTINDLPLPGYEKMLSIAQSLADKGELEQARQWLEKAIEADKLDPGKHYLMGAILHELGLFQEASEYMRHVIYLAPETPLAHFSLGSLSKRLGRNSDADKHFNNALKVLDSYEPDRVLSDSEGITAGGLTKMIMGLKGEAHTDDRP